MDVLRGCFSNSLWRRYTVANIVGWRSCVDVVSLWILQVKVESKLILMNNCRIVVDSFYLWRFFIVRRICKLIDLMFLYCFQFSLSHLTFKLKIKWLQCIRNDNSEIIRNSFDNYLYWFSENAAFDPYPSLISPIEFVKLTQRIEKVNSETRKFLSSTVIDQICIKLIDIGFQFYTNANTHISQEKCVKLTQGRRVTNYFKKIKIQPTFKHRLTSAVVKQNLIPKFISQIYFSNKSRKMSRINRNRIGQSSHARRGSNVVLLNDWRKTQRRVNFEESRASSKPNGTTIRRPT